MSTPVKLVSYRDACPHMRNGDLLLYREDAKLTDLVIARCGRGVHCHAAMLAMIPGNGRWQILEVTQWHGGRQTPLCESVKQYPAHWDLFAANPDNRWPEYDPPEAVHRMRQFVDRDYGWLHLAKVAFLRLPMAGLLFPADLDDDAADDKPPFCSEAVSIAYNAAGVDPVPNLANRYTEPADLARSLFYRYELTLVP